MVLNVAVSCRVSTILVIVAISCIFISVPIYEVRSLNRLNEQLWIKISETYELSQMKDKRIRVLDDKIFELREAILQQKFTMEQLQNELREWKNLPQKLKLLKWTKELVHIEKGLTLWKQMEANNLHCVEMTYSPLPNITLLSSIQESGPLASVINLQDYQISEPYQLELIESCVHMLPDYNTLMSSTQRVSERFSYLDGFLYYCLLRTHQPKRVVQIGSDILLDYIAATSVNQTEDSKLMWITWQTWSPFNSDKFMVVQQELVDVPKETFYSLESDDMIVNINSSHILHRASDVHYFYLEVLPKLNPGVHLYLADIYFPYEDYPIELTIQKLQFLSEDYILQSFLLHNSLYQVSWAGKYMINQHLLDINSTLSRETNTTLPPLFSNSFIMNKIKQ